MFVKWDPENGEDTQEWVFDSGDVTRKDAILIEKHYGGPYDMWLAALLAGQIQARAVMLWYMLYQVHDKLRFEDVPNFRVRQLTTQMGVSELKDLWKRALRAKLDTDQREAFEAQFEEDMRDALIREGLDPDDFKIDGKQLQIGGSPDLPKSA
jgi:hypothetical protein